MVSRIFVSSDMLTRNVLNEFKWTCTVDILLMPLVTVRIQILLAVDKVKWGRYGWYE